MKTVLQDLNVCDVDFTLEEVVEAKKQVKEGKTLDGLKRINIDDIITDIQLLIEREKPDQLSILNIQPIPKSGNLDVTDNYRVISLISLIAKIINRMILNRIRPKINPLLSGNQNGFRPRRSTAAQVLALRRIIEGVKKRHLPAVIRECKKVELKFNAKKTKAMFFHLQSQTITTLEGKEVKQALTEDTKEKDFKYLGNRCEKARDINVRKAFA